MQELKIDNDIFNIPSKWNELTGQQLLAIAALSANTLPLHKFLLKALLAITGLKPVQKPEIKKNGETFFGFTSGKHKYLINVDDITFICNNSLKFLFTEVKSKSGEISMILESQLSRNIVPELKVKGKSLYGPGDALSNFLTSEYIHAETNLDFYYKTKNETYLCKFIAVLYRPQVKKYKPTDINFNGDRREPFNDFLIEKRAYLIEKLPYKYKKAVLLFYEGCKHFISERYPTIHENAKSSNTNVFDNFMNLVNALANNDVTKKEDVRKTYLHDTLNTLEQMAIQYNKMEEEREKLKNQS